MNQPSPGPESVYCVPTIVLRAAARLLNVSSLSLETTSRELGVKIRPEDDNPWHLPVAERAEWAGLSMKDADDSIPNWLQEKGLGMSYTYTPRNQVPFGDGEMFFADQAGSNTFVAAALDWSVALHRTGHAWHVVEVSAYRGRYATVWDWTQPSPAAQSFPIHDFESAVDAANGGFLVFRVSDKGAKAGVTYAGR